MFKRTFRSRHQQDPNSRVDKASRLKKAAGVSTTSVQDAKIKAQRSASRGPVQPTREKLDPDGVFGGGPVGGTPVNVNVHREKPLLAAPRDGRRPSQESSCNAHSYTQNSPRMPHNNSSSNNNKNNCNRDASLQSPPAKSLSASPIITLTVGIEGRVFAAHKDVLCQAPFFETACSSAGTHVTRTGSTSSQTKRIQLLDEEPEVFSAVLEFLYKGDYYPRLVPGKQRDSYELEDGVPAPSLSEPPITPRSHHSGNTHQPKLSTASLHPSTANTTTSSTTSSRSDATVFIAAVGQYILRDTAVYCAAERYGLDELKQLSLRKQGLQSGIDVATILRSAQFAYTNTPDSDSRLRAHYLALIIRCRRTFKRSGTLQTEIEK